MLLLLFKKKNKKKKKKKQDKSTSSPPRAPYTLKLSEILEATNYFDQSLMIGRGGFYGEVYKAEVSRGSNNSVLAAIKRLNKEAFAGKPAQWPQVECQMMATLRHRNLVSLIGYCCSDEDAKQVKMWRKRGGASSYYKETVLVFEYIPNSTTLKGRLYGTPNQALSFIQRLNILIGVARGLRSLHKAGVIHGDVRSANVFLTEYLVPKLSDVGLTKIPQAHQDLTFPPGAYGYLDGYSIASGIMTTKSDVFSFAVTLLEVLCRMPAADATGEWSIEEWFMCSLECIRKEAPPNSNYSFERASVVKTNLVDLIDSDIRNQVSPDCVDSIFKLAETCLHTSRSHRPCMADVVLGLESALTLHEAFIKLENDPLPCAPSVKEFKFDDLHKAHSLLGEGFSRNAFPFWVEENTLAPSEEAEGIRIVVAVESITSKGPPPSHDEWLEEVNFLGQLTHPNVIRLLGYCIGAGNERLLVYEHVQKSLPDFIHGDDCLEPLSWGTRLNILIGVARGMAYLHAAKGVLCDFRCTDILLDEDFNAKIGGFGWIEIQQRHDKRRLKGAFGYLRGDYLTSNGSRLRMMDDVFSFGLVALETITGRPPEDILVDSESLKIRAPNSKSDIRKLKKLMDPSLKDSYSLEGAFKCLTLASRCVALQPEDVPSREEILWSLEQISAL